MIRSMTGFGRAQDVIDGMSISVELKSVNHRYFEFSSRTPRTFGFLKQDGRWQNDIPTLLTGHCPKN